ncbi:MAG: hypothetical protein NTV02_02275 [Candidatus Zambryskibacteria bacterium]|nr:hypothetical protein [Candidatus Zambryskibacteria bacterium]
MKKFLSVLVLSLFIMPVFVFAEDTVGNPPQVPSVPTDTVGNPRPGNDNQNGNPNTITYKITNPLRAGVGDNLTSIVEAIMSGIVMPIASVLVVLAILYSGFQFVVAQGNPAELQKARSGLLWVLIGSAILLGAYGISTALKATIEQITL